MNDFVSYWPTIIAIGLLTFSIRLSFIFLFGRMEIPALVQRALRYVPPAVLAALIFTEIFIRDGQLNLNPLSPRLISALLAGLVAWRTRSILWTLLVGMGALLLLQFLLV